MDKSYITSQTPLTASNVIISVALISTAFTLTDSEALKQSTPQVPYEIYANSSSDQNVQVNMSSASEDIDQQLSETVSTFYAQFISNQEPLGKEFEQILHDNLWDLYER